MGKPKLKPCPWGHPADRVSDDITDGNGYVGYAVVCSQPTCCTGPVRQTERKAIAAWNHRPKEEKRGA